MKKKNVFFRGGIIIVTMVIATSFCWQIARLLGEKTILYTENLDKENWQRKMEWFGTGGRYEVAGKGLFEQKIEVTFADIYSPTVLRGIRVWEESGIAGWLGWDEAEIEAMETKIEKVIREKAELDVLQVRVKKLLTGDSNIMDMTDMAQFEDDIEVIQLAYRILHASEPGTQGNLVIQDEWRNYISGK